jgi:synaptotagmin-1
VNVVIEQYGKVIEERQTRTRKKTGDPVFRESFEVRLSCCHEDLRDTSVRLRVYDHDRLRSDPVLGEVWLGRGAREESVVNHWQEMMHAPGRRLRRWHYIVGVDETEEDS